MTGLMYNKPHDPIDFMQRALTKIRKDPDKKVTWDMFIDNPPPPLESDGIARESNAFADSPNARLGRCSS